MKNISHREKNFGGVVQIHVKPPLITLIKINNILNQKIIV